jgi:hypothetical protein
VSTLVHLILGKVRLAPENVGAMVNIEPIEEDLPLIVYDKYPQTQNLPRVPAELNSRRC